MATASVVAADSRGAQLAAAGALLAGSAGLEDKLADGDLPRGSRQLAGRSGRRFAEDGARVAAKVGLAEGVMQSATLGSQEVEARPDATLDELLAPSGQAVGELFAHTALVAGHPENRDALRRAGEAFGRLVHLCDAIDDVADDVAKGHFNPLVATGTTPSAAGALAESLRADVVEALADVEMVDRALVDVLLGSTLETAVRRRQPEQRHQLRAQGHVPAPRSSFSAVALVGITAMLGVFGTPRRRRRGGFYPPGYDPGYGPGYGYGPRRYRSAGPSPCCCCELCACDCCLSSCCSGLSGDDVCCCCI